MKQLKTYHLFILVTLLIASFLFSLSAGTKEIGIKNILSFLFLSSDPNSSEIILNFRLPKSIAALCCGSALAVCGLMMQTLFRNPLAGPYILGINSGANLFVSLFIMGAGYLNLPWINNFNYFGLPFFSMSGSFLSMLVILLISTRIKNTSTLLLAGIMLGFLYSAVQGLLEYFSNPNQLKSFVIWSMGNLNNLSWNQLNLFIPITFISIIAAIFSAKNLNNFLLGDNYAKSSGTNIKNLRWMIIIITGILSGITVAYCGPIAFVGLIVPHLARIIFRTSNHFTLIPACVLMGSILLLLCDGMGSFFTENFTLPINIITSIIGAPFTIWILMRKNNYVE